MVYRPERMALLTPEQLKVVEHWEKLRLDRMPLYNAFVAACHAGDVAEQTRLNNEMIDSIDELCYHNRPLVGKCAACSDIEAILFPEEDDEYSE